MVVDKINWCVLHMKWNLVVTHFGATTEIGVHSTIQENFTN